MKKTAIVIVWLMTNNWAFPAFAARNKPGEFVQGTVTGTSEAKVQSPEPMNGGSNPSDAPLTDAYYSYEISIRVRCDTYVGRYRTNLRYLPSMFSADQTIQFRLTKHVMYFDVPYTDGIQMSIVRHKSTCESKH